MSYRSWLKDVKSIHDLGEHCHVSFNWEKPEHEKREIQYDEKWLKRLRSDIPVDDKDKFAFGTRMHDSWVDWIKQSPSELRLRINNDFAQHFVAQVADMLDIHVPTFLNTKYRRDIDLTAQPKDLVTPVDLIFEDPVYVNAVRQGPGGVLRWHEWENMGRRGRFYEADQFRYDWFHEQDDRIQWIAEIGDLYLLVDCSRARAEDGRANAIAKVFPQPVIEIWNDMMNRIDLGDDWDGWSAVYAYIERRMEVRGLTTKDLMPELESCTHEIRRTSRA